MYLGWTAKGLFSKHFNIVHKKNVLAKDVMHGNVPNLSFRRAIVEIKLVEWHNLSNLLASVSLGQSKDKFLSGGHRDGMFSVRSMYCLLMNAPNSTRNMLLWKLKLPLKIRIFLWYIRRRLLSLKTT
jgi:hypothetical protein